MKRKIATAVGYNKSDYAPKVLAQGRGREADLIIKLAEDAGITIVEDSALASLLDVSAKPGDYVPEELWETVAKILAFVVKNDKIIL